MKSKILFYNNIKPRAGWKWEMPMISPKNWLQRHLLLHAESMEVGTREGVRRKRRGEPRRVEEYLCQSPLVDQVRV